MCRRTSRSSGFSLVEVIIALAVASVVLSVSLSETCAHVQRVAKMESRYRVLTAASTVLERALDKRITASESGRYQDFDYRLTVRNMPSDPRLDQISVSITGGLGVSAHVSAYRWRAMTNQSDETSPGNPVSRSQGE